MSNVLSVHDLYSSPEEYLAGERVSQTKHEYLAGMIYAMAGASFAHNLIAANVVGALSAQLRGGACYIFGSDMRLRIHHEGATFYYYPDVMVDCSGSRANERENPAVLFEIISPDSDRIDRGDKLVNYRKIASLRAYVLIDQFRESITVFRRDPAGVWAMDFVGDPEGTLELPEIGCSLPMKQIYERVFA